MAVPASIILLGLLLLICARLLRQQQFLYWFAASHVLRGVALVLHFQLSDTRFGSWALPVVLLYLSSAAAASHGLSIRFNINLQLGSLMAVAVCTAIGLISATLLVDSQIARMIVLNTALGAMFALPVPQVFARWRRIDLWDRVIALSYLAFAGFAFGRATYLAGWADKARPDATRIDYASWQMLWTAALLFSLWFAFCLIFAAVRDVMLRLRDERDSDPLTGRLNRRAFYERAAQGFRADPHGPWYLISCDIDHFKRINDTYGHEAGDAVLRRVSAVLVSHAGAPGDLAARFGGEEFVLLQRFADPEAALAATEAMRSELAGLVIAPLAQGPRGSFGLTRVAGAEDLAAALRRADDLLYAAKRSGRNRVNPDLALLAELGLQSAPPSPESELALEIGGRVVAMPRPAPRSESAEQPRPAGGLVA